MKGILTNLLENAAEAVGAAGQVLNRYAYAPFGSTLLKSRDQLRSEQSFCLLNISLNLRPQIGH